MYLGNYAGLRNVVPSSIGIHLELRSRAMCVAIQHTYIDLGSVEFRFFVVAIKSQIVLLDISRG